MSNSSRLTQRGREISRIARESGPKLKRARAVGWQGITRRVASRAYAATGAAELRFNLDFDDLLTGLPDALPTPPPRDSGPGQPIRIAWVMTPPAPGSGGHTTIFRMIEALEAKGHVCTIQIYDRYGVDTQQITTRIRTYWPTIRAEVADVKRGITDVDAVVATSWESAHLVVKYCSIPVHRFYFMQDYEPYFYGHGADYQFAEMTYHLPFRRIALGEMLEGMVQEATGLTSEVIPFGCDSEVYSLPQPAVPRSGIVFYCRPDFPRRGYALACVALRLFHQRFPDQEIHVYGSLPTNIGIPYTFHGRLSAQELNDLYGRTIAGLAMSFTNITLVAEEMLAAGNIPVVNDLELARLVLPNPHVRWAQPHGEALATQLGEAVNEPDLDAVAAAAAGSVRGRSWLPTQDALVRLIEGDVHGGSPLTSDHSTTTSGKS